MQQQNEQFLTTHQVAERFHMSVSTVRHLVYIKRLKPYRQPGQRENLFPLSELAEVFRPKPAGKPRD